MSFAVTPYLYKKFDIESYNCWHLLLDCLKEYHDLTYPDFTPTDCKKKNLTEQFTPERLNLFEKIKPSKKEDGVIAYMTHPILVPHVGFFFDGKILSMKKTGPTYERVHEATHGFKKLEYYRCKK